MRLILRKSVGDEHPAIKRAIARYGTTKDPREAAFITPGGKMIAHDPANYEHDYVAAEGLGDDYVAPDNPVHAFCRLTGCVRYGVAANKTPGMRQESFIDAYSPVTSHQLSTVQKHHIPGSHFFMEATDKEGNRLHNGHIESARYGHISREVAAANEKMGHPLAKALVYKPGEGTWTGTIQHTTSGIKRTTVKDTKTGKQRTSFSTVPKKLVTREHGAPTLGNRIGAALRGHAFVAHRPPTPGALTPHAISSALTPIHTKLRGMGIHYHSTIANTQTPPPGQAASAIPNVYARHQGTTFAHRIASGHNSGAVTAAHVAKHLSATHEVSKVTAANGSHFFTAKDKKSGQEHRFEVGENHHVQAVHNVLRSVGGLQVKTGQESRRGGKGMQYTHSVRTLGAVHDTAKRIGQGLTKTHFLRRYTSGGTTHITATHKQTGAVHRISVTGEGKQGQQGPGVAPPPSTAGSKKPPTLHTIVSGGGSKSAA